MLMHRRTTKDNLRAPRVACLIAIVLTLAVGGFSPDVRSQQQQYPSKPVTIVVPFPPGGTLDVVIRMVAEKLAGSMGQSFIVLNKTGAAGIIGTEYAVKAAPDGYTLVHGYLGTIALNPAVYGSKLPYRPEKDLIPVAATHRASIFLVTGPAIPARDISELVALAKSKPGELTYGTAGIASSQHVFAEFFKARAGMEVRPIHYRGSGPANVGLLGGEISMMFDAGHVMKHVATGKLRAIAIADNQRSAQFPELPTVAETFPGFEASSWHGLFAPAGTPRPIVDLLNTTINAALMAPDMQKRFAALEIAPLALSAKAFSEFVGEEIVKWSKVIETSGVRLE